MSIDSGNAKRQIGNLAMEILRRYHADPKERAAVATELKGAIDETAKFLDERMGKTKAKAPPTPPVQPPPLVQKTAPKEPPRRDPPATRREDEGEDRGFHRP